MRVWEKLGFAAEIGEENGLDFFEWLAVSKRAGEPAEEVCGGETDGNREEQLQLAFFCEAELAC